MCKDRMGTYKPGCLRKPWKLLYLKLYNFQIPAYDIEYETRNYQADLHVRFHTSEMSSGTIETYLWPALLEGEQGPCVQKGVVITQ